MIDATYTVKALLWMDFSNLGDVNAFILVAGNQVNLSKICQCPLKPLILSWAVLIHDIGVIVITIKPKLYTVNALLWLEFSNLVDIGAVVPAAGDHGVNLSKIWQYLLKPLILSWAGLIHDVRVIAVTIELQQASIV